MDSEHLNLRHVRAFYEVGRSGSITAATRRVFLSQSAITQAIANLEEVFEVELFLRKNSGMFLTEPGTLLFNRAQRALANISAGARRAERGTDRTGTPVAKNFEQSVTSAQLRSLLAIAKAKNFSLAARRVGTSQPSLYRAARDLERVSGLSLFLSNSRGVELTPAAMTFARFVRLAFTELNQGYDEVSAWRGRDTSRISIGTLPLSRTYVLAQAIDALIRLRPDVNVRVVDGSYDELLTEVRDGELDILIGALRDPLPIDDVEQKLLFRDRVSVVARSGHPLVKARSVSMKDLTVFPWVVSRPGAPLRAKVEGLFQACGADVPSRMIETNSLIMIRDLLMESDRLALLSTNQVDQEISRGMVKALNVVDLDPTLTLREIGATVRRDWQPTATQTLMMDLLREVAGRISLRC